MAKFKIKLVQFITEDGMVRVGNKTLSEWLT